MGLHALLLPIMRVMYNLDGNKVWFLARVRELLALLDCEPSLDSDTRLVTVYQFLLSGRQIEFSQDLL
jgi:hypothetical protein